MFFTKPITAASPPPVKDDRDCLRHQLGRTRHCRPGRDDQVGRKRDELLRDSSHSISIAGAKAPIDLQIATLDPA
jgi:hypothetical protein